MKKIILIVALLLAMPVFSAGVLTDAYRSNLEQNIEEIEAVIAAGLGTDRDKFMLNYYKKKLKKVTIEALGSPSRTIFTSKIDNREPVDNLNSISVKLKRVYFFTEFKNLNGKIATHRWTHNGKVIYTKDFKIGADRWRVWTNKTITPYADDEIIVQILVSGKVYSQESIFITQ